MSHAWCTASSSFVESSTLSITLPYIRFDSWTQISSKCTGLDTTLAPTKWHQEIKYHAPGVPIILVGTKEDLRDDEEYKKNMAAKGRKPLTTEEGEAVASAIGACYHTECSPLTQKGLKQVFDQAILQVLQRQEQSGKSDGQGGCCNVM